LKLTLVLALLGVSVQVFADDHRDPCAKYQRDCRKAPDKNKCVRDKADHEHNHACTDQIDHMHH
jgi:hypothetical protein